MDAEVTIKFIINDICSQSYLNMTGISLIHMVKYIIQEEGIHGVISDKVEIINAKEIYNG